MGFFLQVVAVFMVLAGIALFGASKSAIHEIQAWLAIGLGAIVFGLGAITSRLTDIREASMIQSRIAQQAQAAREG